MKKAAANRRMDALETRTNVPGLRPGMPTEELMDLLALDALRPLPEQRIDIDPVRYEVAVHRIKASLREGAAALARTSSSPLVTECGEYVFAVYTAEGHAAYVTAGVLPHLTGTEAGIKYIRYCYEFDREGIHPGDQFVLNDPYLLGIHTPDMLVARPIFDGDELVAWIGSLTHTVEIGAKDPGGTADSTDIFQEGLRLPCIKLVSRGEPVPHVFRIVERAVRGPELVMLDINAKIAGNNVAAARFEEMVADEGAAFLRDVLRKLIQETETKAKERVATIPDGRWHTVARADHNGLEAVPTRLELAAEKRDGRIHFDFAGTSEQCPGPVNATLPGTLGALFSVLVSTIFHDLPPNRGIVSTCAVSVPKGCIYNPRYPAPVFASPPGPLTFLSSAATKLVSEMAMAGGLSDRVIAPWAGNFNSVFMGGVDQYGQLQGTLTLDTNGSGTGGTPTLDGDDTSAFMLAPGSIMSDVEMYEANYPLLYLYRRQRRDSPGAGQRRGGAGGEAAVAIHNSKGWRIGFRGLGTQLSCTQGLFGGYPSNCSRLGIVRGVSPQSMEPDRFRDLQGPLDALLAAGTPEHAGALTPPRPMAVGDVYYLAWGGGGGYRDPLLREPERLAADIAAGLVSAERGRDVYGVVLDREGGADKKATERRRQEIRKQRLAEADWPKRPLDKPNRIEGDAKPYTGALSVAMVKTVEWLVCSECRHPVAPKAAGINGAVPTRLRMPAELGHDTVRTDWQVYREYICPECATLFDARMEAPPAVDRAAE